VFLRNDDGSESLVNVTVSATGLIIHRIARQFILRRGRLVGCVVNRAYTGSAERTAAGTLSPAVERTTPALQP
jgi:type IV secretion system protein VirB9